jgi:hypothetical protein
MAYDHHTTQVWQINTDPLCISQALNGKCQMIQTYDQKSNKDTEKLGCTDTPQTFITKK